MKTPPPLAPAFRRWSRSAGSALLLLPAVLAQQAPAPSRAAPGNTPASAVAVGATGNSDEIVQLSPFEVSGADDRGYLATSTLSGTRLNSKIEDLAASISVVTKQQLLDTASTDINDVFKYEANTEGIYQWTSFTNDRGTISDDVQSNPTGATRIRGLTSANTATGGFSSVLPFDTYNVESVEISRGPNSSVFGLGNTGGGVNINAAQANLTRAIATFGTRGDSYGGYRANFDLNRPIVRDKLAARILGVYEEKGYERKPSSDTTRRLSVALTARPFKRTTMRASFESFRNSSHRPNSATPRDGTTDWISSGRPTYDPVTQTVHFGDGRAAISGITAAQEASLLPYGIAATDSSFTTYPSMFVDGGRIQRYEIAAMPNASGTGPTNASGTAHLLQSGTYYTKYSAQYPLYVTPGITNQALYDWTAVNVGAPNFGRTKGETTNVSLEQILLHSPRQTLAFQAAWQGERTATNNRSFLGSYGNNGGKLQVYVDVNEKMLDGTANPYFLRPYVGASRPSYTKGRNSTDNYRANLAYELNLTNERSWLQWLGRHRLSGYGEFRTVRAANLGFSDTISSLEPWMSTTGAAPSSRNSAGYRAYMRYYVGDASGQNVDYGPPGIAAPPFSTTLRYYNGVTQQWLNEPVEFDEYYYANRPNRRLLSTQGGTWQAFLFQDRIVPTFGLRKDYNRTRDANSAINPTSATNGFYDLSSQQIFGAYDWVKNRGRTTTKGVVVKPLHWLHLLYNQSNSFTPGSLAYNAYGQPINDPKGQTRDYGFQFSFFDGRLSLRVQQYETVDDGRGDSTINTIVQRALRMDLRSSSGDPGLTDWLIAELTAKNPAWTSAQLTAAADQLSGIDSTFLNGHLGKTHGDNSTATSRGKELEISFNPTRYWRFRATAAQTRAFNAMMSPNVQRYIDERMSTWTSIKSPNTGALFWSSIISGQTPYTWFTNNVNANLKLATATQGKQRTQTREYRFNALTNYHLAGITEHRYLKNLDVGGAVRWEDRASIGFLAAAPDADGIVRMLDPNKPVWDKARAYYDVSAGYNLRFYNNQIRARLQLNINNVFEDGRLQAVAINPDGNPSAFRIIDPRQFILSATFNL